MKDIIKTTNYSNFKFLKENRQILPKYIKRLEIEISQNNQLEMNPIIVNEKMEVIDGQHRLKAAENLGIPIWYEVREGLTHKDIYILNSFVRNRWGNLDWLHYYSSLGLPEYIRIDKLRMEFEGTFNDFELCIGLISGAEYAKFRNGSFKIPLKYIFFDPKKVASFLKEIEEELAFFSTGEIKSIMKGKKFKSAIIDYLFEQDIDVENLKRRLSENISKVRRMGSKKDYMILINQIYNHKVKNRIELD